MLLALVGLVLLLWAVPICLLIKANRRVRNTALLAAPLRDLNNMFDWAIGRLAFQGLREHTVRLATYNGITVEQEYWSPLPPNTEADELDYTDPTLHYALQRIDLYRKLKAALNKELEKDEPLEPNQYAKLLEVLQRFERKKKHDERAKQKQEKKVTDETEEEEEEEEEPKSSPPLLETEEEQALFADWLENERLRHLNMLQPDVTQNSNNDAAALSITNSSPTATAVPIEPLNTPHASTTSETQAPSDYIPIV